MHVRGLSIGLLWLTVAGVVSGGHVLRATAAVPPAITQDPSNDVGRATGPANPLWLVALGDLHVTTQRPIFVASRRPPLPRPIAAVPVAPPPPPASMAPLPTHPSLVLIGTIIGPSLQTGIFREETSEKIFEIAAGTARDGWTLRSVSQRDARFEMADRSAVLPLRASAQPTPQGRSAFPAKGQPRRREWYDN